MNQEVLSFIRNLSESDKKNLCQKALKTTEEVGELAKAILPFENAAGTLHRFSDRRKILENVVDVFLSSISIAYDMKFSNAEIDEMILEKAKKWQGIQAKEGEVTFPLPYEIHITVKLPESDVDSAIGQFRFDCMKIGVKPIVIHLEKNDNLIMRDVMTSSTHFGDNRSAYEEARRIENWLKQYKWNVARVKIETVPWHPAAPALTSIVPNMPENCYFESHLRIIAREKDKVILSKIAKRFDAHLSRNFFKKVTEDKYIIMMTLRSYDDGYKSFKEKVDDLKRNLQTGFEVDKTEIEFAVYDSKINHDVAWIGK